MVKTYLIFHDFVYIAIAVKYLMLTTADIKLITLKSSNIDLIEEFLDDFNTFIVNYHMVPLPPDLELNNITDQEVHLLKQVIKRISEHSWRRDMKININLSSNVPDQRCTYLWCSGHHHSSLDNLKQIVAAVSDKKADIQINLIVIKRAIRTYNCIIRDLTTVYLEH